MYGISIEHKNKTITITKKFEKLTKNFASDESKELGRAMRQYPTYKLKIREIEKNPDKMTYKGLTYDIMKDYFTANKADRAKYLRDKLDEMRGRKNGKRDVTMIVCSYAEIKAWFFAECPEIEKTTAFGYRKKSNKKGRKPPLFALFLFRKVRHPFLEHPAL